MSVYSGTETLIFDAVKFRRLLAPPLLRPANLSRRSPDMGNHTQRVTSDELGHAKYELTITITEDGTRTLSEASHDGSVIASGEARRRKGDKRNSNIGRSLAMARLFDNLAALERGYLKRLGH